MKRKRTQYKQLTREEEIAAWESGDHDALVNSVWPFVMKTARSVAPVDSYLYDELLSVAGLSIANALKTFDPARSRFISFSCLHLYSRMQEAANRFNRVNSACMVGPIEDGIAAPAELDPLEINEEYQAFHDGLKCICTKLELEVMKRWAAGESLKGIAETRGVTRQAAQSALARGLARARERLPSLAEMA